MARFGAHLVQRFTVDMPEAPDGVSIMGCDAANGTYFQLYSDERGVCRVYGMSIGDGRWELWREGEPFAQRFTATISDDGNTIVGPLGEGAGRSHVGDRLRPHLPQGRVGSLTTHVLDCFNDRCPIHRSAWKGNSANFAFRGFSEVRPEDARGCAGR
jgi:hypothetical protein